ncbi:MAG: PDZ domain-containing protein [Candidatus Eisenbacteria sp.]|nr:PDZ domain-containing protein [Candidatus Eisenbacteria bacterium]
MNHRAAWIVSASMILSLLWPLSGGALARDDRGWLGIYHESVSSLPEIEERVGGADVLMGATCGIRVMAVFPASPADKGGLLEGDIIISIFGQPFDCPSDSVRAIFKRALDEQQAGTPCPLRVIRNAVTREVMINDRPARAVRQRSFWRDPGGLIDSLASGNSILAKATKQQEVLDLPIVLGLRPEARWPEPPSNEEIYPAGRFPESGLKQLVWQLADAAGIREDTEDLLSRLARCHSGCDPYRLECMIYVHRDPFRIESVSRQITNDLASAQWALELIASAHALLVPDHVFAMPLGRRLQVPDIRAPRTAKANRSVGGSFEETGRNPADRQALVQPLLDQITGIFAEARLWHRRAFEEITEEEKAFLAAERWTLSDAFADEIYIHLDEDIDRFMRNQRIIDIAQRIDYGALVEAAARLALLTDPEWAMHAARMLHEVYADTLDAEILLQYESPFGRFLIGGTSRHWYRDTGAAFILDLGGDDFYTGNNGGSSGWDVPLAICIDMEGNDAYESTLRGCQGAGCLGIGGLLDLEGHDQYIGNQWCQGTGYYGIGWVHDLSGNDTYRGRTFCQAVGLFGMGFLLDEAGDDRYEGDCHVQGVGLAKGIGALIDSSGDDEYYAKGLHPTGYGDAGIFDAWSQGCGMGFRTLASGGLGVLIDGAGRDRMEAGNFSQGGGYYYGYGILHALGSENDTYIGSRYNQGFCAHQALGVFLEEGGDDFYTTRQAVAQGLAWDECVTLFVDQGGNDAYQGGTGFSQGASAHNSFCFFLDRRGKDTYDYSSGQARAGGNSYHGGTSFSLFIDEGGGRDQYNADRSTDNAIHYKGEHGFFMDLRGSYKKAMETRAWEVWFEELHRLPPDCE